jgi:hypothetical protein
MKASTVSGFYMTGSPNEVACSVMEDLLKSIVTELAKYMGVQRVRRDNGI